MKQANEQPGKGYKFWFWAAKDEPTPDVEKSSDDVDNELMQLLVDNSNVNASTFLNLIRSRGMRVTKEAEQSTANTAVLVAQTKPKWKVKGLKKKKVKEAAAEIRESNIVTSLHCRFLEAGDLANPVSQTRFRVILIQEGLGNMKDGFYYTKEALQSAVPVFEGRKFMIDHPSRIEEESRPERSVRDIAGHYENVEYKKAKDGTAYLEADLCVLADEPYQWVRALLRHATQYSKKYPDKEFIGLSINASGDAEVHDIEDFYEKNLIPDSAKSKIKAAIDAGLTKVRAVHRIDDAVSCDLVTEAGAKGRIIKLLEAQMKDEEMGEKNNEDFGDGNKEKPAKEKKEADEHPAAAGDGEVHDDEQQDMELIKKMLKKHLGDDMADDADAQKAAKHYTKAFEGQGYEKEEAASRAVEAMKCAGNVQEDMEAEESADTMEKNSKPKEGKKMEKQKEAEKVEKKDEKVELQEADKTELEAAKAENIRLAGENASFKEQLDKIELKEYLDTKLVETKLPMAITKKFRESVKEPKSKKEIEDKLAIFLEGYKMSKGSESDGFSDAVMTEKQSGTGAGESTDFGDCLA